jgi:lactate dehydrogenase-like 2-hydroxyacid dehydrogenase
MTAGNSDKVDVLIYGQPKELVTRGLSGPFTVHSAENRSDLDRLSPAVVERIKGVAVTGLVSADKAMMAKFPKLEIVSSFGVGYDHIDSAHASQHGIIVTNTPDVLTEEVADVALGLLISTLREFVHADRYVRSGQWAAKGNYPLTVGSLRGRTVGMVGMGRIGQAIARRLEASLVPVVYHSRNPAAGVANKHYPNLLEMAKAVDTLVVITPGGASTAKIVNAAVLEALGPNGVVINVARGSVIDEEALIAALKARKILAAGLDVFANEPKVPDELIALQNTVLLPHVGSASIATRNAMDQLVVDNLKTWFAGKPPLTPVAETPAKNPGKSR